MSSPAKEKMLQQPLCLIVYLSLLTKPTFSLCTAGRLESDLCLSSQQQFKTCVFFFFSYIAQFIKKKKKNLFIIINDINFAVHNVHL